MIFFAICNDDVVVSLLVVIVATHLELARSHSFFCIICRN